MMCKGDRPLMADLKQVFMPTVINVDGNTTALGVTSKESDAWDVLRAFFARAEETEFIELLGLGAYYGDIAVNTRVSSHADWICSVTGPDLTGCD